MSAIYILKRLSQNWYEESAGSSGVSYTELLGHYWKAYQFIAQRLRDNDTAYEKNGKIKLGRLEDCGGTRSLLHYRYEDAFCKCPYMKWLGVSPDAEYKAGITVSKEFNDLFSEVIKNLISPEKSKSLGGPGGDVAPTYYQ